jgi:hypothetical protein
MKANRQTKRQFGKKITTTQFGGVVEQLDGRLGDAHKKLKTVDEDIDTLMIIQMSRWLDADEEIQKLDILAVGFLGRLQKEDGTLEDLPFQGGVAQYMLIKRFDNGEFIPGFEEKMKGMKIGDKRSLEIQFPKNYHEHLAGKTAVFDTVLIAAWRMPENVNYVDGIIQQLFKDKSAKDKASKEMADVAALKAIDDDSLQTL